jgi:hypothetical protein
MKHIAQLQIEFLKHARKWDDLSFFEQRVYLKRHPKSKRRLTAKLPQAKLTVEFRSAKLVSNALNSTVRENLSVINKLIGRREHDIELAVKNKTLDHGSLAMIRASVE